MMMMDHDIDIDDILEAPFRQQDPKVISDQEKHTDKYGHGKLSDNLNENDARRYVKTSYTIHPIIQKDQGIEPSIPTPPEPLSKDSTIAEKDIDRNDHVKDDRSSRKSRNSRSRSRDLYRRRRYSRSRSREGRRGHRRSRSPRDKHIKRSKSPHSRSEKRGSPLKSSGSGKREERKRSPSPELTEAERDRRTVFVQQLAARLKPYELKEFLSKAGRIRDVKIVTDKLTGRSKGFGYVEFYDEYSVAAAILMSGEKLLGIPIAISYTESEKNRIAAEAAEASRRVNAVDNTYTKLYVGSIHSDISEELLRELFTPYGVITNLTLHRDPVSLKSKGFAHVQYKEHVSARRALEELNGLQLAGMNIRVGIVSDKLYGPGTANTVLDDPDTHGMPLSAHTRTELMMKLARDTDLIQQVSNLNPLNPQPAVHVEPTVYILLSNIYDPDRETEPNWADELTEDISEECSKFGSLLSILIAKNKMGEIYLKYQDVTAAQLSVAALHHRWFGGRQISATFLTSSMYQSKTGRS